MKTGRPYDREARDPTPLPNQLRSVVRNAGVRKVRVADLAIAGGAAAFREPLHVGEPNVGDRERLSDRINDLLDRRRLTNDGPYVQEFERRLVDALGVKHCVAMSSGMLALEIAIRALGLTGEVIVPSFTFVATAHALEWQGIKPIFCDIDPDTHTIDPRRVEEMITPRTTGIIGVHMWGRPCCVDELSTIADRNGIKLIFDAAHAVGCSHGGRMVGGFGAAEVFSFHATKFLNSFEGGAVATDDDDVAAKMRLMRNFGFAGVDHVISVGTNGKMSEVSAAMGLTGLESMEIWVDTNYQHYKLYQRGLEAVPGIKLVTYDEDERCNYQYVLIEIDETTARLNRDELMSILHAENIWARRYFYPGCHNMEPYKTSDPEAARSLPETGRLVKRVLCLPTGSAIGEFDIATIVQILQLATTGGGELRQLLSTWNALPAEAHFSSSTE